MGKEYQQLGSEERAVMMVMRYQYRGVRTIARMLKRSPSTISRELARNAGTGARYDAKACGARAQSLRFKCRSVPKLGADTALFGVVAGHLREGWSPEQTAGTLKRMWPDDATQRVSHETIYNALYLLPRGELRAELIACLRQGHAGRWKRSRGVDRRGQIRDMVSLHVRPPEVADRQIPGHWEGDLIRGAYSRSAVGTLVERSSRLVLLARMTG
ncbi:MAG: IS30 family transposase, partial [Pseudonocardiaceae bacterium]